MRHLLIGGPKDGELVDADRTEIRMWSLPKTYSNCPVSPGDRPLIDTYHRETFCIGEARAVYFIYRHQSITVEEAFHRLLDHYKPEKT